MSETTSMTPPPTEHELPEAGSPARRSSKTNTTTKRVSDIRKAHEERQAGMRRRTREAAACALRQSEAGDSGLFGLLCDVSMNGSESCRYLDNKSLPLHSRRR